MIFMIFLKKVLQGVILRDLIGCFGCCYTQTFWEKWSVTRKVLQGESVTREIKYTDQIGLEKLRFDWLVTLVTIKTFWRKWSVTRKVLQGKSVTREFLSIGQIWWRDAEIWLACYTCYNQNILEKVKCNKKRILSIDKIWWDIDFSVIWLACYSVTSISCSNILEKVECNKKVLQGKSVTREKCYKGN